MLVSKWRGRETGYALVAVPLHKDKSALLQRFPARCLVVAVLVNLNKKKYVQIFEFSLLL
jgi:hypothetical protein